MIHGWFRNIVLVGILRSFITSLHKMSSNGNCPDGKTTPEEEVVNVSRHKDEPSPNEKTIDIEARRQAFIDASPVIRKSFSDRHSSAKIEGLDFSSFDKPMGQSYQIQDYRIFVGTWNVGGRSPNNTLNLEDFLQIEGSSDIYILGFQEIVPLNAGNVLVIEDNEPAAKWLGLIGQALNRPQQQQDGPVLDSFNSTSNGKDAKSQSGSLLFFQKPSLKVLSKSYRATDSTLLKSCNCPSEVLPGRRKAHEMKDLVNRCSEYGSNSLADLFPSRRSNMNYVLISSKQMVGIFLSVWVKSELVQYVGHLRTCSIGRGILNCLGNKGCIAISMSLHHTSFCFVCSHLTSGEKEGDELKRNSDVAEILRSTQFPNICKSRIHRIPEKILEHDRVIWLGDLNYRVSLSYDEARARLEEDDWNALLKKDQLRSERAAGRVFSGWKEGKITFAPTYKYSQNSDCYAGENTKSKKKRRTPAWCDRILWYGEGMEQLLYDRGESRFSDHRPVFSVFSTQVELFNKGRCRKGFSSVGARMAYSDYLPHRHSSYEC